MGLLGPDPITAYILQQTSTDTTIAANAFNRDSAVGGDGSSFAIGSGMPESRQQGAADMGAQLGLTKDKKSVYIMLDDVLVRGTKLTRVGREFHSSVGSWVGGRRACGRTCWVMEKISTMTRGRREWTRMFSLSRLGIFHAIRHRQNI